MGTDQEKTLVKAPSRLVLVETLYHQITGEEPSQFSFKSTQRLTTDEQVFTRRCKIEYDWVKLETGWLKEASRVLISNTTGSRRSTIPTEEEQEEVDRSQLIILLCEPKYADKVSPIVVKPGDSVHFVPFDLDKVYLRATLNFVDCTLTTFPK